MIARFYDFSAIRLNGCECRLTIYPKPHTRGGEFYPPTIQPLESTFRVENPTSFAQRLAAQAREGLCEIEYEEDHK